MSAKWEKRRRVAIAIEEWTSRVLLAFIVLLVFIAALTRFLGVPINWSVDIAQALFIWVVYLGANQAFRASRHIGVDLLLASLGETAKLIIGLTHYCLISAFLGATIYNGIRISIINAGRIIQDIPISYSFVTMAVPVGSALMVLTAISKMRRLVLDYHASRSIEPNSADTSSTTEDSE